jgi:AcrR family transcriptional regulator
MSSEIRKRPYHQKERAERRAETRARIAAATASLHEEVGPARTTVTEVARRAGVQRPTVYNNFPDERGLFAACQAHFLTEHPPPDPTAAFALPEPADRVRAALEGFYRWYRENEGMTGNVQHDRRLVPELDALLTETSDAQLDGLADALAAGFPAAGRARTRALVRLALDFATWHRLKREGLADDEAAELMSEAARAPSPPTTLSG